jgi:hypothetical protein
MFDHSFYSELIKSAEVFSGPVMSGKGPGGPIRADGSAANFASDLPAVPNKKGGVPAIKKVNPAGGVAGKVSRMGRPGKILAGGALAVGGALGLNSMFGSK